MRRISAKRLKKLGGKPVWSSISKRSSVRKTNPKRKKAEFARTYHSKKRVEFVKTLCCASCRIVGQSQNAHVETDGMGRKAHYTFIVPLCRICHANYDQHLPPFDNSWSRHIIRCRAAETESRWLAFSDSPRKGMQE